MSDLRSTPVDNDLVILNLAKGNYVNLDAIGRRIWQILEVPTPIGELHRLMTNEFAGDPEQIARDVIDFLDELYSEGLITVTEVSGADEFTVAKSEDGQ